MPQPFMYGRKSQYAPNWPGKPMPVMDGLLMATAQCHGLTVVTRNVQDFAAYQQVFNPWAL
jgi:hypothetical protein